MNTDSVSYKLEHNSSVSVVSDNELESAVSFPADTFLSLPSLANWSWGLPSGYSEILPREVRRPGREVYYSPVRNVKFKKVRYISNSAYF